MMKELGPKVSIRGGNPDGEKFSGDTSRGIWGLLWDLGLIEVSVLQSLMGSGDLPVKFMF